MDAEITVIVITDTKLFNRTGDIRRWADRVEAAFTAHAIAEAPLNRRQNKNRGAPPVGTLKAGISGEVTRVGPRQLQTIIKSEAPYTLYVLKGTTTIFSKTGRIPKGEPGAGQFVPIGPEEGGMSLPPNFGIKRIYRQRVRGQSANNFLGRAFDATARTHSSLRGYQMGG